MSASEMHSTRLGSHPNARGLMCDFTVYKKDTGEWVSMAFTSKGFCRFYQFAESQDDAIAKAQNFISKDKR